MWTKRSALIVLVFLWLAPPLAAFALLFGPAEYFWLALFGLTIIASLSEGNLVKGLMSGFLGLALSQIGISVVSGDARFTWGNRIRVLRYRPLLKMQDAMFDIHHRIVISNGLD